MSDMIVLYVGMRKDKFVIAMRRPGEREQNIQQFFFHLKQNHQYSIHRHKHTHSHTHKKEQIILKGTICLFKSRKHFQLFSLLCLCFCLFYFIFSFGLQQTMAIHLYICVCACVRVSIFVCQVKRGNNILFSAN